jgi:glutaredoxin 3
MPKIQIYTKDYCPYCTKAKATLKREGWEFEEIDITKDPAAFDELKAKSNHMTVPQIFVDENFIGGSDDLDAKIEEVRTMMK